jgi:hypothetical protein
MDAITILRSRELVSDTVTDNLQKMMEAVKGLEAIELRSFDTFMVGFLCGCVDEKQWKAALAHSKRAVLLVRKLDGKE